MGILDGGLSGVFGAAFGPLYLPAVLHRRSLVDLGDGSLSEVVADVAVRAQVDAATEAMRQAEGYADGDVRILVLAAGVPALSSDDWITVRGQRWSIQSASLDPAASHWDCRGRRA